ncbi:uncharacterized protein [Maniola hyperantus]|uniref:uncharacterized protein isoform X1 n=1 Tax=Aphantopus hyperantus TaxID=2795564 RepID=UPI00213A9F12
MCKIESPQEEITKSVEVLEPTKYSSEISVTKKRSCCVTHRTGCLIFAYLYLVVTIGIGLFYVTELVILMSYTIIPKVPADYPHNTIVLLVLLSISIALLLIAIPFNTLVIIGLHSERQSFMKVYIAFQCMNLTLSLAVRTLTMSFDNWSFTSICFAMLAYYCFDMYYLVVIKIQYDTMVEAEHNQLEQLYTIIEQSVLNEMVVLQESSLKLKGAEEEHAISQRLKKLRNG